MNSDVYNGTGYSVRVTAILPDGTNRRFTAGEPFSPDFRKRWETERANHLNDWWRYDAEFRKESLRIIDTTELYKKLAKRAADEAWVWVNQEMGQQQFVKIKGLKRVYLKFDIKPLIHGLRYIRFARTSQRSMADAIAFAQLKQPEDEMLRLMGPETSKGSHRFEYYVLVNPEEKATFNRRVLDAQRAQVSGAMKRGVEVKTV